MPMYMLQASYTAEGLKGLIKDTASGRSTAIRALVEAAGGKLESIYYSFGKYDVVLILNLPDNSTAAGVVATVASSGMVRARTTPLLTVEEMDKGLSTKLGYQAPGSAG